MRKDSCQSPGPNWIRPLASSPSPSGTIAPFIPPGMRQNARLVMVRSPLVRPLPSVR